MSYLLNIGRFSGEDNLGGLLDISIARAREVAYFPPIIGGLVYEEIQLKPGFQWVKWWATAGTASFRENESDTVEGKLQKYDLNFDIPKDSIDRNLMFAKMKNDFFIVLFRDTNNKVKVFGSLEHPVRFTSELATGASTRNKNGYSCRFYTEGTSEVVNFYTYEMPDAANEIFIGQPVTIKKNGQTIAEVPAGSIYEVPPTEWEDLQGSIEEAEALWGYISQFESDLLAIGIVLQTADIDLDTVQELSNAIQALQAAIESVHNQNTDTKLAEGTDDEVSATEIRDFIDNPPFPPPVETHEQNTDTALAEGTSDEVTAAALKLLLSSNNKEVLVYDAAEQVSLGMVRAYAEKFWEYINAAPTTGTTPVEGAHWKEISKAAASQTRASQAEAETAITEGTVTNLDDGKIIGLRGLWYFFAKLKNTAFTFAQKITFTTAARFSSVNPSQVLKVDANKDLTSGAVANAELATMPALSVKLNNTNAVAAPTDLQATVAERVLVRGAANAFAFIQLTSNYYADLSITQGKLALLSVGNAQMAQMPANTVKSNLTGLAGPAADNPAVNLYHSSSMFLGFTQDENPDIFTRCPWTNVNDVSLVSINGTTARASLMGAGNGWGSKTRKAYTFTVGQEITIELMGLISFNDNTAQFELRTLIGATVAASTGPNTGSSLGATNLNRVFYAKIVLTVRSLKAGAVMGKMDVQGFLQYQGPAGQPPTFFSMGNTGLIDFDNTTDISLDVDGQFIAADTSSSVKCTKSKILIAG